MNTSDSIRQTIAGKPQGAVFSCADFSATGTRAAVDQALCRLVKAGEIVRVARGLFAVAGQAVNAQTVACALAQKTGERVVMDPHTVSGDVMVVPTSGLSRRVKSAEHTLQFQRMSPKKIQLGATTEGRALLALWMRGHKHLTTVEIQQATGNWPQGAVQAYAHLIPAWLLDAVRRANAPRKSARIGLSGAYDWSNPQIKDDVLIAKVLETHKFEDVTRLCLYYGVPKVRRVLRRRALEPVTRACVSRMLANISKGLRASAEIAHD
jgi:hypothetical protein